MELIKKIWLILILAAAPLSAQELSESELLIQLYKENYIEWVTSPEIQELQENNPDIKKMIDAIPVQQTKAYREMEEELRQNKKPNLSMADILGDGAFELNMQLITELLSPENTEVVTALYWKIIQSSEANDIAELILSHMQKARKDIEEIVLEMPHPNQ